MSTSLIIALSLAFPLAPNPRYYPRHYIPDIISQALYLATVLILHSLAPYPWHCIPDTISQALCPATMMVLHSIPGLFPCTMSLILSLTLYP
ncbi:hypothetical protein PoB_005894600 [Plakobranchus ocellatus]|uniref:Uncharacterized protein n=1 Tax=Plakobranchus ocellatus TaxID=259542 RepID=A0AAV4CAW5_9GAST|nr:hypothetical protein PoB_005894600 [Plakobranchus ocellatus]